MGGTVAVTIRRENGEIIKMARKTGSYKSLFFSKEFSDGHFDLAIDNYIKIFNEMKEDYDSGAPYKYPMSTMYGWCNELAPCDYGLVVIDFKDKTIYSMQDYDYPGFTYFTELLFNDTTYITGQTMTATHDTNQIEPVYKLLNCSIDVTREELEKIVRQRSISTEYLLYDKQSEVFQRHTYKKSGENTIAYFLALKDAGFTFNDDEIEMWKEFCKYELESDLEDSDVEVVDEDEYFKKLNLIG